MSKNVIKLTLGKIKISFPNKYYKNQMKISANLREPHLGAVFLTQSNAMHLMFQFTNIRFLLVIKARGSTWCWLRNSCRLIDSLTAVDLNFEWKQSRTEIQLSPNKWTNKTFITGAFNFYCLWNWKTPSLFMKWKRSAASDVAATTAYHRPDGWQCSYSINFNRECSDESNETQRSQISRTNTQFVSYNSNANQSSILKPDSQSTPVSGKKIGVYLMKSGVSYMQDMTSQQEWREAPVRFAVVVVEADMLLQ